MQVQRFKNGKVKISYEGWVVEASPASSGTRVLYRNRRMGKEFLTMHAGCTTSEERETLAVSALEVARKRFPETVGGV